MEKRGGCAVLWGVFIALLVFGVGVISFCPVAESNDEIPPLHPNANVQIGNSVVTDSDGLDELGPDNFGTRDIILDTISWVDFFPRSSDYGYASNAVTGNRYTTSGSSYLYASLNQIPHGAKLLGFDIYYYDNSSTNDLSVSFCRYTRVASDGSSPGGTCMATFTSTGMPGHTHVYLAVPDQFQTILRRGDVDSNGIIESVDYVLYALTPGFDGNTAISHVRAAWQRQVSPAPATATFLDVPTSHPFFQFIEALAASGITGGCGGGNFCPNNPVTRGQMAVFLSAALGLHWHPF